MSLEEFRAELGAPLTASEVGELLGIDPRTVRKYPERLGGVWVAPGCLRFFENRIREIIYADGNEPEGSSPLAGHSEDSRQDGCLKMVRPGREGAAQSNNMGGSRKKANPGRGQADPHGIFNNG
jgi:hypothetical protein